MAVNLNVLLLLFFVRFMSDLGEEQENECPFKEIVGYDEKSSKYTVRLNKKKNELKKLSKKELCKYPMGRILLDNFNQGDESEKDDNNNYDSSDFDKIDTILQQTNDKYFVLWKGCGFEDASFANNIDPKSNKLKLFRQRLAFPFPPKNSDVKPSPQIPFCRTYKSLNSFEMTTFNKLITCFNNQRDILLSDSMALDSTKSCIYFLRLLQETQTVKGPYLVVTENSKWLKELHDLPELLPLYYFGNDTGLDKINELYFSPELDSTSTNFHVLIIKPDKLESALPYISHISYKVAFFIGPNAKSFCRKRFLMKNVEITINAGINICITKPDISNSAIPLDNLMAYITGQDVKEMIMQAERNKSQIVKDQIQPIYQRLMKPGSHYLHVPPIRHVNCPFSPIQKKLCQSIVTQYSDSPQTAISKLLRLCSHPFLVSEGEYSLGSPDLLESSTKLQILNEILEQYCDLESETVLIISNFQQNIEIIIDLLCQRGEKYQEIATGFDNREEIDALINVYLYNCRYALEIPPLETIKTVIIYDGNVNIWKEILKTHRESRKPYVSINNIFYLENIDCYEHDLFNICEPLKFNLKHAQIDLNAAIIHAFSDFSILTPREYLESSVIYDEENTVQSIRTYSDFSPKLTGEIIKGSSPDLLDDDKEHEWTIHERNLLTRGLFQIGYGRWEVLQHVIGLYLPIQTIKSAALSLISIVIKASNTSTGYNLVRSLIKTADSQGELQPFQEGTVFKDEDYIADVQSKAPTLIKRLELLFYLANSLGGGEITPDDVPPFRIREHSLMPDWWNEEYDNALAYLTYKFGIGNFDHYGEFPDDRLSKLFINWPQYVDQKILTERAIKICEVAKRTPMTDHKIIENLSKTHTEQFTEDVQQLLLPYLLNYGVDEGEKGEKDYEKVAENINSKSNTQFTAQDIEDYINYLKDLSKENEGSGGLAFNLAARVINRIETMSKLRKLLRLGDKFIYKIESAPRWRNITKKWTPEMEYLYFTKIEQLGFANVLTILQEPAFIEVFENSLPPSFILQEDDIAKRINFIFESKEEIKKSSPVAQTAVSSSGTKKKRSGEGLAGFVSKRLNPPTIRELKSMHVTYPLAVTQNSELLDIGTIVYDRPDFHSERYIYPAGYKVTRLYTDLTNPAERTTWISEIIDTGKKKPLFRAYQENDPKISFEGETPSAPWVMILKKASKIKGDNKKTNTISGPETYLFTNPIIIYLIQHLPNIEKCTKYVLKKVKGDSDNEDK